MVRSSGARLLGYSMTTCRDLLAVVISSQRSDLHLGHIRTHHTLS